MTHAEIEAWRRRKAEIVERYGSADAAAAPCDREKLLLAAVAPWRTTSEEWTVSVDGWRGNGSDYRDMPARALQAIKAAIPLPTSFADAKAEVGYWQARNAELQDVLSEDGTFSEDVALDLVAEVRAAIVRDLALYELHVENLADLRDRCALYRETGADAPRFQDALLRDIDAMAEAAQLQPSAKRTDEPSSIAERIRSALAADPSISDRGVARLEGCSPTTVGRVRAAMGLRSITRAVTRHGQRFEMRVTAEQAPKGQ